MLSSPHAQLHASFDAITTKQLRAQRGMKWSAHPQRIGAFVAEMDFGTAPAVSQALHEAIRGDRFGYPTMSLFEELGSATSQWLQARHHWQVAAEVVRAVPDVIKALEVMMRFHLPASSTIVVPTPCYMPFIPLIEQLGHRAVQVPLVKHDGGADLLDFQPIEEALAQTSPGQRAVLLCNPHNPVGRVYRREELLKLCEIVEQQGARVMADEIHSPLVYQGHTHIPYASISAAAASHSITTVSASKAFNLAGLKCAQILYTNPDDLRIWQQQGHLLTSNSVSPLGIMASIAAYREGGDWFDGVLDYLQGNRDLLSQFVSEQLPRIGYREAQGTYLAWLDCSALRLPKPLGAWFGRRADVVLTDGAECGDGFEDCVRFNFALPRPILQQALQQIARAIDQR